jgi:hypothetical protein
MLVISPSTGQGTAFHYDEDDKSNQLHSMDWFYSVLTHPGLFYSTILVLWEGGHLHLPETGYKMQVLPDDVVSFQALQQLHKLENHVN